MSSFSVIGCLAAATTLAAAGQQIGRAPVEVRVSEAPTAVIALGRPHVVYELHLTNMGRSAVTIEHVAVSDQEGRPLAAWSAPQVQTRMTVVGRTGADAPTTALAPGQRGVVWAWITLPPGAAVPRSLVHRVVVSQGANEPQAIVTSGVPVDAAAEPMRAPVGPGRWIAVRGPSPTSPHRVSLVTMDGGTHVPQRFAVDWVRLGDEGRLFRGDPSVVTNWHAWDAPVYATGAGTVALVRDATPDHPAMNTRVPEVLTPAEAPGNVVVVDLGAGRYATYAHLRRGSATVAAGDRVKPGQILARIGNSGNTLAPHLHFQVADRVEPLAGEGRPFSLDRVDLVGRIADLPALLSGGSWAPSADTPARTIRGETPLENMVITVGG